MIPDFTPALKDSIKMDWSVIFETGKNVVIILATLIIAALLAIWIYKKIKNWLSRS